MNKPTKIYGFFDSTEEHSDAGAIAISEDGRILAQHYCSSEGWAAHDLGMDGQNKWKHELYDEACPDGWVCEFVRIRDNRDEHEGLQSAFKAHVALQTKQTETGDEK